MITTVPQLRDALQANIAAGPFQEVRSAFGHHLAGRIAVIGPIVDRLATLTPAQIAAVLTGLCQAPDALTVDQLNTLMTRLMVGGGALTAAQAHRLVNGLRTGAAAQPVLRATDIYDLFRTNTVPVADVARIADSPECLEGLRFVMRGPAGTFTAAQVHNILAFNTLTMRDKGKLMKAVMRAGAPNRTAPWTYAGVRDFLRQVEQHDAPNTGAAWEKCIKALIDFDRHYLRAAVLASGAGGGVYQTVAVQLPAAGGHAAVTMNVQVRNHRVNHFRNEHTNVYYSFDLNKPFIQANHFNNFWPDGTTEATIQAAAVAVLATAEVRQMITTMRTNNTGFSTGNASHGGILYSAGINVYHWGNGAAAVPVAGSAELSQFYPDQLQYRFSENLLDRIQRLM